MIRLFSRWQGAQELCSSRLFNSDTFYKTFTADLRYAVKRVYIESPFITTKRMEELLPILHKLQQRGVHVTINTRDPKEHSIVYKHQAALAVYKMQELDVAVLYTGKLHRKLAIIDDEILWEGSLNILSQNDSCEVMRRSVSQQLACEMTRFIDADRWI